MGSQRVLITAGASGIGRAMAHAFAQNGASVAVIDIDEAALKMLAAELPGVETFKCDVSSRVEIEQVVPQAIGVLGGLDVLVNNAGISGPTAPVESFDPDAWDKVMQINLGGTFNVTRLAIPHLKQSGAASIIVMSSVAGRFGYPNRSAYSTSKWGLIGFTKTLSRELGEWGIRVNAILPGAVAGQRIENVLAGRAKLSGRPVEDERREAMSLQSLQRFVDPNDIAALALFITSDAGKSISGQLLPIDNDMQQAS
ncbi:SDR family oxidoreductase [Paraburkholderia unamae]|uniref:NAD(P)-dependent dehydrogenase (Short-subunit alcohol dehydrogenase family) n=1 Tax=Paraburkholderia unamae TaxID=219649 RepID=A0ABX5KJJ6_9BURK|nr:SDR family oxidoreductase [Paraburkholderia unamae]PVX79883.1 NAD(P)-dependent dehydrogenase (short-subunit alcohol dehydrogenase family) [Paraburkholderia unamae]